MKRTETRHGTLKITLVALFAALTAAGTFIAVPIPGSPVPVVLQNLFALLAGLLLGPRLGSAAVATYLIVGAIGVPVFAGAKGGFVHFFGPTGGYLIGYLLCAFASGIVAGRPVAGRRAPIWLIAIAAIIGFAAIYAPGIVWLKHKTSFGWVKAFTVGFVPFVIGDLVKAAIAIAVAPRLRRVVAEALDA